jgi:hypothetical protein
MQNELVSFQFHCDVFGSLPRSDFYLCCMRVGKPLYLSIFLGFQYNNNDNYLVHILP